MSLLKETPAAGLAQDPQPLLMALFACCLRGLRVQEPLLQVVHSLWQCFAGCDAGLPPRVLSFLPGAQGHVLPATTHVAGAHLYQEPCTALVKLSINNFSLGLTQGMTEGLTGGLTGGLARASVMSSSSSSIRSLRLKHYIWQEYRDYLQQRQQQMRAGQASGDKVRQGEAVLPNTGSCIHSCRKEYCYMSLK